MHGPWLYEIHTRGPRFGPRRLCAICDLYATRGVTCGSAECRKEQTRRRRVAYRKTPKVKAQRSRDQQWHPVRLVNRLRARDGDHCHLCGKPINMTLPRTHRMGATIDHVVPRSLGGGNEQANLQLAHWECNLRKGNGLLKPEQLRIV